VPEDSIQNELKAIYTMFGGKPNFEEQLAKRGETLDDVKKQIEENLILQKYFDTVVYKDVNVTEEELRDAYEKGSTATVQHILLLTQGKSEEEKAAIYKKMEEILKRAKAGEDFGELAKEFSEDPGSKNRGGLYEDFPRGQMVKEFEEAAFNLPVGSISDIIETEYGYHIMKILNRKKDERPYEKAKEDIRNALLRAKKRDITVALLDSLKKKYEYEELFDQVG
jgi:parvulin-like peptidyl-prolyl isomerase